MSLPLECQECMQPSINSILHNIRNMIPSLDIVFTKVKITIFLLQMVLNAISNLAKLFLVI